MLLIAGAEHDAAYAADLRALVDRLNLAPFVRFLGSHPNVADILGLLDVYAVPSHSEGTSLALLEAMAAGAPIVATAVPGNQHVLRHGVSGLLVAPRDAPAMAEALCQVLAERDFARRLARGARAAVEPFAMDRMVYDYIALYEEVLHAHGFEGHQHRSVSSPSV